ncbi:phospholipase D-like domain-containing protein [Phenylobacterium montanum]|uniref:Phospholipase D n=1 Tax=Phenylobacterium montanum TaxID=2823693 RepID=A0A975G2I8_9CAUL|nr:phospholipase D-like domain-containing protein [Caulobacter sp. S6]QUD89945.1 phospholipase [Caulobacter sp. S6]
MGLLEPGETCWRIERAGRVAFLIDTLAYFDAVREALARARRSVTILGWGFDPRTRLQPDGTEKPNEPDEIGNVLIRLSQQRPTVEVRVLIWRSALPISASQEFFPHRAHEWFAGTRVRFRLDDAVPFGACHHQKVVVVDDAVAICASGDFAPDRWDSQAHLDRDSRRLDPNYAYHVPRHEVAIMVDGAAAKALGDLARERWRRACGEVLAPPDEAFSGPWPKAVRPHLTDVSVAIARTEPAWHGRPAVREWRALTLRSIAEAQRSLYLENQYFTSPVVEEALARRLAEPDGPEIVLVSTEASPSYFDRLTMDRARALILRRLRAADRYDRFRAFRPRTVGGKPIIVHSKLTIVDDRLVRIGSANLNNRSGGFDTEVELAVEGDRPETAEAIRNLRNHLIGHFLGRTSGDVAAAIQKEGGLVDGIEALRHGERLQQIAPRSLGPLSSFIARSHLGDPDGTWDSWRVDRRRRRLRAEVASMAAIGQLRD